MAILDIIEAPHPILAAKARDVRPDEFGPELAQHMADMAETMYHAPGVGLAAPQVGDGRRIVVADPGNGGDEGDERKLYLMVNPQIVARSRELVESEEQCLSVPEMTLTVKRHYEVTVRWQEPLAGEVLEETFQDWPAIVLQHELDHLVGTTLYDRASVLKRSRYVKARKKALKEALVR